MTTGLPGGSGLRRRLRAARIEAALTGPGTALILGGMILVAVLVYVLETRGLMRPGAWLIGLAAGLPVLALKVVFDLSDRADEADLWREVLAAAFGPEMRQDPEVSRQARQAIEFRARLADAEAKAGRAARARIAAFVPRLDPWLEAIVRLAREICAQRGEVTFQSGLATKARSRRAEVEARAGRAGDADLAAEMAATLSGLGAQIASAEGFSRHVETGVLRLEHSVAAFGSVCSNLTLLLAREAGATGDIGTRIGQEIEAINLQIAHFEGAARALVAPEQPPEGA